MTDNQLMEEIKIKLHVAHEQLMGAIRQKNYFV